MFDGSKIGTGLKIMAIEIAVIFVVIGASIGALVYHLLK